MAAGRQPIRSDTQMQNPGQRHCHRKTCSPIWGAGVDSGCRGHSCRTFPWPAFLELPDRQDLWGQTASTWNTSIRSSGIGQGAQMAGEAAATVQRRCNRNGLDRWSIWRPTSSSHSNQIWGRHYYVGQGCYEPQEATYPVYIQKNPTTHSEAASSSSGNGSGGQQTKQPKDPWQHYDPWQKHKLPTLPLADTDVKMKDPPAVPAKKLAQVEDRLKEDILAEISKESNNRMDQLEADMQELKIQNGKFEHWFTEAADANRQVQEQVQSLREEVTVQKTDSMAMASEIRGGFAAMQQMLQSMQEQKDEQDATRLRTEWWFAPGPCSTGRVPGPAYLLKFPAFFWLVWTSCLSITSASTTLAEERFMMNAAHNLSTVDYNSTSFLSGPDRAMDCGFPCSILVWFYLGALLAGIAGFVMAGSWTTHCPRLCHVPRRRKGLHRPRLRLAVRRRRRQDGFQKVRCLLIWLCAMNHNRLFLGAYAATDPCGSQFESAPTTMLAELISAMADQSQEPDELAHSLQLMFLGTAHARQEEQEDWITLHSYMALPYRGEHRSAAALALDPVQHQQILRMLWPLFDTHGLHHTMVHPHPLPRLHEHPADVHYILWRPPLFGMVAVLVDFESQDSIVDRQAVTLPSPLSQLALWRHFNMVEFCDEGDDLCQVHYGHALWPVLQPPLQPLPPGQYLRVVLGLHFADANSLWRRIRQRRRPRERSRSRTPPPGPYAGVRVGEASHPGPGYWLGSVNPTGLRHKEQLIAQLPAGVWGIQETHLSGVSQKPCLTALRCAFQETGQKLFCVPGAPVALRARSAETGVWAGVLFASSLIAKPLNWNWPQGEFQMGRIQAAQFWAGPFSMIGINLYGWSRSPTWPKAIEATNEMLETVTKELILSRTGPRFVVGDFNLQEEHAPILAMWRDLGWTEVQDWAFARHQRAYTPTCKKTTYVDKIFVSAELLPYLKQVRTWELFADHDVIGVKLDLPVQALPQMLWPLPGEVPWSSVDFNLWKTQAPCYQHTSDSSARFQRFCAAYEQSFEDCIHTPEAKLPSNCKGRGTITAPVQRVAQCPTIRASRPGEVQPAAFQLGRAVMNWFRQLRRFQSLVHSLRAQNYTVNAQLYRVQLWHSIRVARGFQGSFPAWWTTRQVRLQGLPTGFPTSIPSLQQAELLFHDFQYNYRRFESWHVRRRREILENSFQASKAKAFKVLRPEMPNQLTFLERHETRTIASVALDGTSVFLDDPMPTGANVSYAIDGVTVEVAKNDDLSYQLEGDCLFWQGQEIDITTTLVSQQDIQEELRQFWLPRWCREPPSTSDWSRILQFAKGHLPAGRLDYSPITAARWSSSLRRYAPHAARGPDGFTRQDLKYMPSAFSADLMDQMAVWESTGTWPRPLLSGFVHPLAKRETCSGAGDYRPIVIYPLIYRSWGSIRSKQILRHLMAWTSQHQFGFVPGVEAAELFYVTQALIEVSVLEDAGHCGLVTDLQKAFECLPREPVWQVAEWLGVPTSILRLWKAYLRDMQRYFRIDGQFGVGLKSSSGFPEGCALSCAAMGVVNVCFHAYMKAFAPHAQALSYVDNLELVARDGFSLLQAQIALLAWTDAWSLTVDEAKTFVWATTPELRGECAGLRRPILRSAKDLGAQVTYGKGHFVAEQAKRIESLGPLWTLLRRSVVSLYQKQMLIQQALWPRAFYGISICRLGWSHIRSLRTAAVRALNFGKAGAHPGIRLFLLCPALCDPGFYQTWQILTTFRRLWHKQRSLHTLWDAYINSYRGDPTDGPFGKMLEVFGQLGWTMLHAPWVQTKDGLKFDLADISTKLLYSFTEDAWAQFLASEVCHRQDFHGLAGIDVWQLRHLNHKLRPHQAACAASLQEGAFVDRAHIHKFDLGVNAVCQHCDQQDTLLHRATICPGYLEQRAEHQEAAHLVLHRPISFGLRLLPSRHPRWGDYLCSLQEEQVGVPWLHSVRSRHGMVHLFTDGSCWRPDTPVLSLGAWAVVSATHDAILAAGVLPGLDQSSDRAEVYALVVAVEWAINFAQPVTLWSDSSYASSGLQRLLVDRADIPEGADNDLWLRLQAVLHGSELCIRIQHVVAHRAFGSVQDLDEWTAYWNSRADRAAVAAHRTRSPMTMMLWKQLCADFERTSTELTLLVDFHVALSVAAQSHAMVLPTDADDESPDVGIPALPLHDHDWAFDLPLNWRTSEACQALGARFGVSTVPKVLQALLETSDAVDSVVQPLSWLEVTCWLHDVLDKQWPIAHASLPDHWIDRAVAPPARVAITSLAAALRWVRAFFAAAERAFSLGLIRQSDLDLRHVGVQMPLHGALFRIRFCFVVEAQRFLKSFTSGRLIRVANDFSRAF